MYVHKNTLADYIAGVANSAEVVRSAPGLHLISIVLPRRVVVVVVVVVIVRERRPRPRFRRRRSVVVSGAFAPIEAVAAGVEPRVLLESML
jgi:hypothetical protein